jgi:signal transduction histidine kinase
MTHPGQAEIVAGMTSLAEPLPVQGRIERRHGRSPALDFSDRVIVAFVTAEATLAGMQRVISLLRSHGGATRIEWWAPTVDGRALELAAAEGRRSGRRSALPLGPAGALVVTGAGWAPQLVAAINRLAPLVRRRWTDEQLALQVAQLARRNEALEDFASLVAHELKAPLNAALLTQDGNDQVGRALDLVDALLEAARSESAAVANSSPVDSLEGALRDLGVTAAEISADLPDRFPLPGCSLQVVLRNLLANAVAAGARQIHIAAVDDGGRRALVVDDDGAGLDGSYTSGSGVGLGLIRRLVARYGGSLELSSRPVGGTRVLLEVPCT